MLYNNGSNPLYYQTKLYGTTNIEASILGSYLESWVNTSPNMTLKSEIYYSTATASGYTNHYRFHDSCLDNDMKNRQLPKVPVNLQTNGKKYLKDITSKDCVSMGGESDVYMDMSGEKNNDDENEKHTYECLEKYQLEEEQGKPDHHE